METVPAPIPPESPVVVVVEPVLSVPVPTPVQKPTPKVTLTPKVVVIPPIVPVETIVEEVEEQAEVEVVIPEKILYPAVCATCELEIEVPFPPDPSRPTFCKDCLRDYQRAVAREKQTILPKAPAESHSQEVPSRDRRPNTTQVRSYVSSERPMSLAQVQYIEPKKFKALRRKPDINVDAVRALIDGARQQKGE